MAMKQLRDDDGVWTPAVDASMRGCLFLLAGWMVFCLAGAVWMIVGIFRWMW
jgi:hypothetical protein